jgi:hypothetical protein
LTASLKIANELTAPSFENPHDTPTWLYTRFGSSSKAFALSANEDSILMKRCASRFGRNGKLLQFLIVRNEETSTLPSHLNAAGHEVCLGRNDVTTSFDLCNFASLLEVFE